MINDLEKDLEVVWLNLKKLLLDKNKKYGNAVLEPPNVFSKLSIREQIAVYMDNKLSRMLSHSEDDEDPQLDFVGYWFFG